jgi:cytolysin (calcineurin-like family phosphatase)
MQKIKKHIAVFLLLVFSLAALPPSVWHDAFADHKDIADNYCDYYHKDLGTHIENSHNNCDIFKTNVPVYEALKVLHTLSVFRTVISQYKVAEVFADSYAAKLSFPARAPPIA